MQQYAEERRVKAAEELDRLRRDHSEMAEERKENDRLVEETKQEADALERKVGNIRPAVQIYTDGLR